MSRKPVAIGLLTCDQVIIEESTHNVTPVNCWTHRAFRSFPASSEPFVVLAFLTDGLGEVSLEIVIHSLDNWDELRRASHAARFDDVLKEYRCTFRIRDLVFPTAGHFQVTLLADTEIVAQRKLTIVEKAP